MRTQSLYRVCRSLALAAIAATGLAGCTTGGAGGFLRQGQELTPQAEFVLDHAPKVAPVARELCKTVPPSYVLEPGDTVLIEAIRFDSPLRFPADQVIQPDGTIDLGKYGRMVVAGKRIEEVEVCVEEFVNADPDVQRALQDADLKGPERVNVRLIDPRASVFYVLGAVNSPGSYPYTGRETVLDAVLAAGGLGDNARKCEIILSRPTPVCDCRTVLPVCWNNIVQLGDTTTNYQLMPGDRIFVPANGCFDQFCSIFKHDDCPRCCCPQCAAGFASVKCPFQNTYELGCPPYAGTCPPSLCPAPTGVIPGVVTPDGLPPAPSGPTVAPPAAPSAEPPTSGIEPAPVPEPAPVSMLWRRGVRTASR
jgi:protein involved in polysaccharide export with SLBB domain